MHTINAFILYIVIGEQVWKKQFTTTAATDDEVVETVYLDGFNKFAYNLYHNECSEVAASSSQQASKQTAFAHWFEQLRQNGCLQYEQLTATWQADSQTQAPQHGKGTKHTNREKTQPPPKTGEQNR